MVITHLNHQSTEPQDADMLILSSSSSSCPDSTTILSLSKNLYFLLLKPLLLPHSTTPFSRSLSTTKTTMSIRLKCHAFAGNQIKLKTPKPHEPFSPATALETLKSRLLDNTHQDSPDFKVLPFRKGRPLASSDGGDVHLGPKWKLGWIGLSGFRELLGNCGMELNGESLVYLGCRSEDDVVYWGADVSKDDGLVAEFGKKELCFVELRTLMVATDWDDERAMSELAIVGHARALLEWHRISRFCGHCGGETVSMEAGRQKQCINELCKKKVYPRIDPVVIMLVIDGENDTVLLSRQSRFVPRMWSCLAGFIEPGESLEEAVRRETWEETGIEVGEVVYHSSQPWPVGPNSMPCQLMVGFFAYAKSRDIKVDKEELEDAQWHSRDDVKKALMFAEYKKAQRAAASKVSQMCKGVEKSQSLSADFNVEGGELTPMFFPGPFAIAHHLISSWAFQDSVNGAAAQSKQPATSMSSL